MAELTAKQRAFCEEYVKTYNQRHSYQTAYECSYEIAVKDAWRLMKKPQVREYITELEKEAFEINRINAEHIANELSTIAFAEKGDKDYNANAKLRALDLLQKQLGLQQQKVEQIQETTIKVTIDEDEEE